MLRPPSVGDQNMILAIKNAIPETETEPETDVAGRIVRRTLAKRENEYAGEVRRLLDAALEVMGRCGTSSRPRVADIVAAAGLSNEAFYRHFRSKDALVTAILEDGGERLRSYLAHQLAKEPTPEAQVRRWVEGVLAQASGDIAVTTLGRAVERGERGRGVGGGAALRQHAPGLPPARAVRRAGQRRARARRRARRARHPRQALGLPVAGPRANTVRDRPRRRLLPRGRPAEGLT